jgi:hypothetical protein
MHTREWLSGESASLHSAANQLPVGKIAESAAVPHSGWQLIAYPLEAESAHMQVGWHLQLDVEIFRGMEVIEVRAQLKPVLSLQPKVGPEHRMDAKIMGRSNVKIGRLIGA